jgi:hypothetical protein
VRLQVKIPVLFVLVAWAFKLDAIPLLSQINNESDFGYAIVYHSDVSSCSLNDKHTLIFPHSVFNQEFLLERGKPSVILRPVFYTHPQTQQTITFVDQDYQLMPELLEQAFNVWKSGKGTSWKKIKTAQQWYETWVGGDISVMPHEVEIAGYLINLSRAKAKNNNKEHVTWLSFAKGIFSKLLLKLDIYQKKNRAVMVQLKALHGEGGLCSADGRVERIGQAILP